VNFNRYPEGVTLVMKCPDVCRSGTPALTWQPDTFHQAFERGVRRLGGEQRMVPLGQSVARMGQMQRQIAVIGKQEQPLGIVVKPSYRVNAVPAPFVWQQVEYSASPLRVSYRGHGA
jgi:hypothetical protein